MNNYYIISFRKCGSTQEVAKEFIEKGLRDGTVVICEEMSEGRGRKGRKWIAEKGGLWLTLVRSPPSGRGMHLVGLAAGLAVAATIRDLFPQINPCVKWPNDVYLDGKKLAGILTEAQQIGNSLRFLFVGVGVNLNNEAPLPSSISLRAFPPSPCRGRVCRPLWRTQRVISSPPGCTLPPKSSSRSPPKDKRSANM